MKALNPGLMQLAFGFVFSDRESKRGDDEKGKERERELKVTERVRGEKKHQT